ncbi:hypothetical protein BDA96_10G182700 [Sorghum bicolor]|uniref:Uncharacterized protein n=1 Tax=Sorghum bicolor TaxID=4558 RepID=A0A921Q4V3_SORBI|nr:hypothetical protein BDA96_10G182700 [Sorghum bicolor]
MGDRRQTHPTLYDISITIGHTTDRASVDEERIKREERNRKQHEYRARKRAEETTEQRDERNRKQREYCTMKKARAISKTLD